MSNLICSEGIIESYINLKNKRQRLSLQVIVILILITAASIALPFVLNRFEPSGLIKFETAEFGKVQNQVTITSSAARGNVLIPSGSLAFDIDLKFNSLPFSFNDRENIYINGASLNAIEKPYGDKYRGKKLSKNKIQALSLSSESLFFNLQSLDVKLTKSAFFKVQTRDAVHICIARNIDYNLKTTNINIKGDDESKAILISKNKQGKLGEFVQIVSNDFDGILSSKQLSSKSNSQFLLSYDKDDQIGNLISANKSIAALKMLNYFKILNKDFNEVIKRDSKLTKQFFNLGTGSGYIQLDGFKLADNGKNISLEGQNAKLMYNSAKKSNLNETGLFASSAKHSSFVIDKLNTKTQMMNIFLIDSIKLKYLLFDGRGLSAASDFANISVTKSMQDGNLTLKDNAFILVKRPSESDIKIVSNDIDFNLSNHMLVFNDKVFIGLGKGESFFADGLSYNLLQGNIEITNKVSSRKTIVLH